MATWTPAYETRLMRVSSKDRAQITMSNTNFQTSTGNVGRMFAGRTVGVSIESIVFPNFVENVPPNHGGMDTLASDYYLTPGLVAHRITIATGQHTDTSLAAALNDAFTAAGLDGVQWDAVIPSPPTMYRLSLTLDVTHWGGSGDPADPVPYLAFPPSSTRLPQIIGIPREDENGATRFYGNSGAPQTYYFRTNLNAPGVVFLHSERLTAGRQGLETAPGFDVPPSPWSGLATIPITVPFGVMQSLELKGDVQPTVAWPVTTNMDFSLIDLSLRDNHGDIVDIGTGELNVTFRLWIPNRLV